MESKADLNLNKDYLTEKEAAVYCCVSAQQFRRHTTENGIVPAKFMGKKIFRKSDLSAAIERKYSELTV